MMNLTKNEFDLVSSGRFKEILIMAARLYHDPDFNEFASGGYAKFSIFYKMACVNENEFLVFSQVFYKLGNDICNDKRFIRFMYDIEKFETEEQMSHAQWLIWEYVDFETSRWYNKLYNPVEVISISIDDIISSNFYIYFPGNPLIIKNPTEQNSCQ